MAPIAVKSFLAKIADGGRRSCARLTIPANPSSCVAKAGAFGGPTVYSSQTSGEVPEAKQWAALARAIYSKVLATYSKDGYYYEGFEHWIFATPWIIHYLDAQKHATGEDLFDQPGLRKTHLYAAHSLTPGGQTMFDFGDVFEGPITRAKMGDDYERSHPGGHFESNYNLLYDLGGPIQRQRDSRGRRLDEEPGAHRPGGVVDAGVAQSKAESDTDRTDPAVASLYGSRCRLLAKRLGCTGDSDCVQVRSA